jgi:hypothetical protein
MMAKTSAPAITRDDWLQAIAETAESKADSDPDLVTYADFAAMAGMAIATASKQLNTLAAAGRAVRTTKLVIAGDGKFRRVVAFRLKKR